MYDYVNSLHRGFDPLASGQVTGHELDTLRASTSAPADHSDVAAGVLQPLNDEPP
jgi:hypothetical protein